MNKTGYVFIFLLLTFFGAKIYAQEEPMQVNPNSVYPVTEEHKLYKRTVWRRMDLDEKQNWPFFSKNNEITKIILEAVEDGRLTPYLNDSLTRRMTKEEFKENLIFGETGVDEGAWGDAGGDDAWGGGADDAWGDTGGAAAAGPQYYFANQLKILQLKEDVFFDKIRSRMYYDIQSISIYIPADQTATGIEKLVGVFRYKDLEQLFRSMPNEAIWYNPYNTGQHRNLADAFLLRLFSARVIKVSNPLDTYIIDDASSEKDALYQSQIQEHKLVEFEHDLWSY